MDTWLLTSKYPLGMDVTELAKELQTANPDLPSAEAEFMKAANAAQAEFNAGEIDRQEYQTRIRTASNQYRSTVDDS